MLTNGDRLLSTVLWRVKYRQQLNIAALGACKYRPCGHSTSFEDKFSTISQTNAKLMLVNRISCLLCDKHFTESELKTRATPKRDKLSLRLQRACLPCKRKLWCTTNLPQSSYATSSPLKRCFSAKRTDGTSSFGLPLEASSNPDDQ